MGKIEEGRIIIAMNFIDIEQFASVDLRVGTVLEAEEVEGSEKLIKFVIDLGAEQRQVLGGLKISYTPEELVGKQVIVVANLAPRSMMGLESQGMILAASDDSGKPIIISPQTRVPNGTKIK